VQLLPAALPGRHQVRLLEHAQVLHDAEAGHRQALLECAQRLPVLPEQLIEEGAAEAEKIGALRDRLHRRITSELDAVVLNGSAEHRLPGNLNISFSFVEGEGLMMAIKDVAVSSGSACTSASLEPSYVLRSMGLEEDMAHSSIRFGLGRFNTEEEVDYVADLVIAKVKRLREMSPLYEMHKAGIDLKSIQWAAH
jgi:cysteine desulfurase